MDESIKKGQEIMRQCKEAVFEIFKDIDVSKESLIACINSLFIWGTKEIYFKSKGDKL
ncbi:MAG: hypothetical protein J7K26_01205 [Candidatus Aenigmarchaeota archaeon]|nr:hypothetical protein [Candidatus Aenigmarchaeota archaeon]